ncbi:MAG: tetratricopeptide repeat protein [Leptolyngbyaceae cyanobacterium]
MLEDLLKQLRQKEAELGKADPSGLAAIFELSWQSLSLGAQTLGCFLSLFGLAPISRNLLEQILENEENEYLQVDDLDKYLTELTTKFLLQVTRPDTYALHDSIRECFGQMLSKMSNADELKRIYCRDIANVASQMDYGPRLAQIQEFIPRIPHIIEAATTLQNWLLDKDLTWPYICLGRFYEGQSAFDQAELWYGRCSEVSRQRFGDEHPDVATSLHNLALLYRDQGRYSEAEPLYQEALAMRKRLLGDEHPSTQVVRDNLQSLQESQNK